ncbi:MAG: PQQ-dependent sugar dehydrogenase [Acidobacteriota bacterium]
MRVLRYAAFGALLIAVLIREPIAAQSPLTSRVHASGLTAPVAFVQDPTTAAVQFVVEQGGRIRVVQDGVLLAADFLDLRGAISAGGERGLLGLALAPDYAASGRFYVNFTNPAGHTVVARFRRATGTTADPASRLDLRWPSGQRFISQPYANHNAGNLAFGPDGYLYIGLGDGGSADDPENRAQNPAELLGKMLRIDVNVPDADPTGYVVPPSNPFVSGGPAGVLREIWSFGLRNPWRYSFDAPSRGGTGALIIGDVGQGAWEEIDYEPAGRGGRNYGWRDREGAHSHLTSPPPVYNASNLTDPIHEYDHAVGQSITGGLVYRGARLPATYRGRYFFADYVQGRIFSIALTIDPATGGATASTRTDHTAELGGGAVVGSVSSFGLDAAGELYFVSYTNGTIVQITSAIAAPPTPTKVRIIR